MAQTRFARIGAAALLAFGTSAVAAAAAEPTGEWAVDGGFAHVRIENCAGKLWGIVSWEEKPGVDSNNPDPSKRDRPTLGMPVLRAMTPAQPNRWDGEIYNTNDGRMYTAHIGLVSDDVLRVEGCVLGFLCGGQNWTRVKQPPPSTKGVSLPSASLRAQAPGARASSGPPPNVCGLVAHEQADPESSDRGSGQNNWNSQTKRW